MKLVSNFEQITKNIETFNDDLKTNIMLQNKLSYFRAWYALRINDNEWAFGPSKFIGYKNMNALFYQPDKGMDGRQTERQLKQWFYELDDRSKLYTELNKALRSFLARYGKIPSAAFRLNVHDNNEDQMDPIPKKNEPIVDLIIATVNNLGARERHIIKTAIN